MSGQREREIQRLRGLFDKAGNGEAEAMYQVFRASLALRPAPTELISGHVVEFDRLPALQRQPPARLE